MQTVQDATPFNTNIHVNLEALNELPEQYAALLTAVHFNTKDLEVDFTKISGKYMPKTQIMYKIAEARGVRGSQEAVSENVYEDVNINPMLCKGYEDQPTMRKMHTGCSSTKTAIVTEDDGTESPGAPCTVIDAFWNDCLKQWAKEEEDTEGYSKVINGEYTYYNKKVTGKYYMKKNGQYTNATPLKFDNKWKRTAFYEAQKDLSMNMAQTKSWLKCIREKAGLITAYDPKDLQSGELIFSKIVKSSEALKMESLSYLSSIEKGTASKESQNLLFGYQPEKNVTDDKKDHERVIAEEVVKQEEIQVEIVVEPETPSCTPVEEAIAEIECGCNSPFVSGELKQKLLNIKKWLEENLTADQSEHWADIKATIKEMQGVMDA